MKLFTVRQPSRETTGQTETNHFTGTPHNITPQPKQKMIAAEEAVLIQTLALLLPPLIFGTIPKCFDKAV